MSLAGGHSRLTGSAQKQWRQAAPLDLMRHESLPLGSVGVGVADGDGALQPAKCIKG